MSNQFPGSSSSIEKYPTANTTVHLRCSWKFDLPSLSLSLSLSLSVRATWRGPSSLGPIQPRGAQKVQLKSIRLFITRASLGAKSECQSRVQDPFRMTCMSVCAPLRLRCLNFNAAGNKIWCVVAVLGFFRGVGWIARASKEEALLIWNVFTDVLTSSSYPILTFFLKIILL